MIKLIYYNIMLDDEDYDLNILLPEKTKNKLTKQSKQIQPKQIQSNSKLFQLDEIYFKLTQEEVKILRAHSRKIVCFCCDSAHISEIIQRDFGCRGCSCCLD